MIVSYHPPLFKPTSSFTLANPLQKSLLRLASAGVSVYSPHSALDSIHGGVNDWIASAFGEDVSITYFNTPEKDLRSRVPDSNGIQGYPGGRLATLKTKITLEQAVAAVKKHFGLRQGLFVALSHVIPNAKHILQYKLVMQLEAQGWVVLSKQLLSVLDLEALRF